MVWTFIPELSNTVFPSCPIISCGLRDSPSPELSKKLKWRWMWQGRAQMKCAGELFWIRAGANLCWLHIPLYSLLPCLLPCLFHLAFTSSGSGESELTGHIQVAGHGELREGHWFGWTVWIESYFSPCLSFKIPDGGMIFARSSSQMGKHITY